MQNAGVDCSQIDAERYEMAHTDPRITVTVAIDPAGGRAIENLTALKTRALIINLGNSTGIPDAMRADDLAAGSRAEYVTVDDSWHFSFLAECSALGRIVMWAAGEDLICSDVNGRDLGAVHDKLSQVIGNFLADALAGQPAGSN